MALLGPAELAPAACALRIQGPAPGQPQLSHSLAHHWSSSRSLGLRGGPAALGLRSTPVALSSRLRASTPCSRSLHRGTFRVRAEAPGQKGPGEEGDSVPKPPEASEPGSRPAGEQGPLSEQREVPSANEDPTQTQIQASAELPTPPSPAPSTAAGAASDPAAPSLSLDDVNPYGLGRRSRQFLDDVFRRILELGQLARPVPEEKEQEELIQGPNCEFAIPGAQFTRVLVVGPTGRVGRVLVRKLLLRGYLVRVLVRKADFRTTEQLPGAVEVMELDLQSEGISEAVLKQAVQGCQKVIYCATARNTTAEELAAVDTKGVVRLAKTLLDYNHQLAQRRAGRSAKSKAVVVKFNKEKYQQGWKLREGKVAAFGGGNASGPAAAAAAARSGAVGESVPELAPEAEFEITGDGNGLFQGYVVERGAYVEVKRVLEMPDTLSLGRFEGLVIRLVGDGKPYSLVLEAELPHHRSSTPQHDDAEVALVSSSQPKEDTWSGTAEWAMMEDDGEEGRLGVGVRSGRRLGASGATATAVAPAPAVVATSAPAGANGAYRKAAGPYQYVARFNTRKGPSTIRIPFSAFRPSEVGHPPLDPSSVTSLALRYEQRRPRARLGQSGEFASTGGPGSSPDPYSFKLQVNFIKAFPGGDETDFVLVSCTGAAVPEEAREAVLKAKTSAEAQLRNSGLGYTIVRPGPLFEEPGGRRALVFDQGNRISQGISCADVADVCVKALHDPLARNKSFDICYEYTDGSGLYELVAHLPDKANNYLTPALALLEKNT